MKKYHHVQDVHLVVHMECSSGVQGCTTAVSSLEISWKGTQCTNTMFIAYPSIVYNLYTHGKLVGHYLATNGSPLVHMQL